MPKYEATLRRSMTGQLDRFQRIYGSVGIADEVKSQMKEAYLKELNALIAQISAY